jgi:hypothetical protein
MNYLYFKERFFTIYRKLRIILNYLKEKFSQKVFFKLFVVICLLYQLIKLTIDYTEYKTIMDLRVEEIVNNYMAVTVCV